MLNCPATNNTCPARLHQANRAFRAALSDQHFRAYELLPVDEEVYRESLLILLDILVGGCDACVRNTVVFLTIDMKWPPNRGHQILLAEELLRRSIQRSARVQ